MVKSIFSSKQIVCVPIPIAFTAIYLKTTPQNVFDKFHYLLKDKQLNVECEL